MILAQISLEELEERVRAHFTDQRTLALESTGLIDEDMDALVRGFLPDYNLTFSDVSLTVGDGQVTIHGQSSLPFVQELTAEVALSASDEQVHMALRLSAEPEEGPAIDLASCLDYFLPGAETALPGLSISAFSLEIDTETGGCEARVTIAGDWSIDLGATALALQSLTLEIARAGGQTTGAITGVANVATVPLAVSARLDDAGHWSFAAATEQERAVSLASVVAALLPGSAALPPSCRMSSWPTSAWLSRPAQAHSPSRPSRRPPSSYRSASPI